MTTFILVRHGQTDWNQEERFRGRTNLPLNEMGEKQAEAVSRHIAERYHPSAVYSSPMGRAIQTAEVIARSFNLEVQIEEGLQDIDYGRFAGLTFDEAKAKFPKLYHSWFTNPEMMCFPEGESLVQVRVRSAPMILGLVSEYPNDQIVMVSHQAVLREIITSLLHLGSDHYWQFRCDTASITVLNIKDNQTTLVTLNDTCHLVNL